MKRLRVAVIGVGHLGKEHARILAGLPDVDLVGVADANPEQAQAVARRHDTQAFNEYWPLLNLVDAASIVVPTSHHLAVAREFLRRGIHLLVEKPLACTTAEAGELVELAARHGAILQVGHIERFNPAYEDLRTRCFEPKMIRAQRMGPFTGRSTDVGVVLDLMIHDIDLILGLVQASVRSVEAVGMSCFGGHEDVAMARLLFVNGCVAEMTASRASPTASRLMQIWGPEGHAEIDFATRKLTLVQPSAAVRRNGLDSARLDPASRSRIREELFTRHLEMLTIDGKAQDQLTCELEEFVTCVRTGRSPRVTGQDGLAAIHVAEQILGSLREHAWSGSKGPLDLPPPGGLLFPHRVEQDVA
ncbi:MAG: Gfo/Idh/MocA family oxidoreductase [Planctomycetes bacterium]|nr:Gfo/Idh/MocA family oxidoreductase [Planctomycetota bacterium]